MKQTVKPAGFYSAIERIMEGVDDAAIAKELAISRTTAWRWRNDPEAVALISAARNRQFERVEDRLSSLAVSALTVLETALNDPSVALTVKLKAATTILDRVGLSERYAIERTQESKASEQKHTEYLTRLEDPMDPIHLM
jgi:hypothetical protein